jgi:integrase/recombinase XerD
VTSLRQRVLDELQRRNYSPATTRGYILAIKQFADYFGKSPERLGGDEIRQFETYLLRDKKLAPGTVEGRMSALRFLYKKTLKRRDIAYDDLIFPKTPRKLPVVLSPEEVSRMIEAAPNHPDGSLCYGRSPDRGIPSQGERRGQRTDGYPCSPGQRFPRS